MVDYTPLNLLWWALVAFLVLRFVLAEGFDIGIAMLLPVVGRCENERRMAINVIAPGRDGNPAWIMLGGGAVIAAWPVYGTGFSIQYLALLLLLCALFLRPFGFDFRTRISHSTWRRYWDKALFCGGLLPALMFGLASGHLFSGAAMRLDGRVDHSLLHLLQPFSLFCMTISILMLLLHGSAMLVFRTSGPLQRRSRLTAIATGLLLALLFGSGPLWLARMEGLLLRHSDVGGQMLERSVPSIDVAIGGWLANFAHWPPLWLVPMTGVCAALITSFCAWHQWRWPTFMGSCTTVTAIMLSAVLCLFPFVLPPSMDIRSNLLLWEAAVNNRPFGVLLVLAVIALPCIIAGVARGQRILHGPFSSHRSLAEGV